MKQILAILLTATSLYAGAQNRDNVYVDLALNGPGLSGTYDRRIAPHLNLGAGLNTYNLWWLPYSNGVTSVYADLRPFWGHQHNLWFMFVHLGPTFYSRVETESASVSPIGIHTAVGFGYCYKINKKGMGPYASLGINSFSGSVTYNTPPNVRPHTIVSVDSYMLLSIGFKF